MLLKIKSIVFFTIIISFCSFSQTKDPLSHSVYDDWKSLSNQRISNNGNWVVYEINPQKGDGQLFIYNTNTAEEDSIQRGTRAKFSASGEFISYYIKTQFDTIRQAKIDKLKDARMPKDSLGVYVLRNKSFRLFDRVKSFNIPKNNGDYVCILHEEPLPIKDTTKTKDKKKIKKKKKDKNKGTKLEIYYPLEDTIYVYENVSEYTFSDEGNFIGIIINNNDSIESTKVILFNTSKKKDDFVFENKGNSKKITIDKRGKYASFIHSSDTIKNKTYSLYLSSTSSLKTIPIIDTNTVNLPKEYSVSEHGRIYFSEDSKRIFFGISPKPILELKDTIPTDEKVSLDIWHYQDKRLQTQQLARLKTDKKKSFKAIWNIKNKKLIRIEDDLIDRSRIANKGNSKYAIGFDKTPYEKQRSWDANYKDDYYLINLENGKREKILDAQFSTVSLSATGKFVLWYNENSWFCRRSETTGDIKISGNVSISFTNELHDTPSNPGLYGIAGWSKNDKYVFIYDRFDIWKMDPEGKEKPVRVTTGRENQEQYRIVKLDNEKIYIDDKSNIFIRFFNEQTKDAGYASLSIKNKKLNSLISGDYKFSYPSKAKNREKLIWKKGNFEEYPDLWISDLKIIKKRKISNTNPQQKDYLWGSVELFDWEFQGESQTGLLYKPENFDTTKSYPLLVYFYERYTNELHRHYVPKPIRSVINFPYYTSNGYFIFIPDITYKEGYPGKSAEEIILSGTKAILKKSYIDNDNVGIQGQSWGGYQVAFLVTKTNMFKAAMAGAPVSNMTSAYGGIRWSTGMNRMFQYEMGQSRIGTDLWSNPELYIENSPLFGANKINTPLLIMHNDNDGAVPWYQGIELFVALRRLDKPVWMLNYNNAPHNLSRRADCEDLTIRMQQFFDHYLKGKPAPEWLLIGRPAIDKEMNKATRLVY